MESQPTCDGSTPMQSAALSSTRQQSAPIRTNPTPSEANRSHQKQSEAIRGRRSSRGIVRHRAAAHRADELRAVVGADCEVHQQEAERHERRRLVIARRAARPPPAGAPEQVGRHAKHGEHPAELEARPRGLRARPPRPRRRRRRAPPPPREAARSHAREQRKSSDEQDRGDQGGAERAERRGRARLADGLEDARIRHRRHHVHGEAARVGIERTHVRAAGGGAAARASQDEASAGEDRLVAQIVAVDRHAAITGTWARAPSERRLLPKTQMDIRFQVCLGGEEVDRRCGARHSEGALKDVVEDCPGRTAIQAELFRSTLSSVGCHPPTRCCRRP